MMMGDVVAVTVRCCIDVTWWIVTEIEICPMRTIQLLAALSEFYSLMDIAGT
jgi:hypothetical protein